MKLLFWLLQVLKLVLFLLLIFAVAGTFNYWQGWLFFIYIVLMVPAAFIIFRDKMDLAEERIHPGPGMKSWDKVLGVLMILLVLITFIVSVLDGGRYKWTEPLLIILYVMTYVVLTVGNVLIFWGMYTCKWFSSVVRIQKDRKQRVVSTGPYALIRHPGYLGAFFIFPTIPLALGSMYGLIPSLLILPIIIIRTYLEDKTLQKELKGYKEYTKKVKFRLLPGIW